MLRILLLTFQGDLAGSTNSISYLAKGLAERGHTVVVGCRIESLLYEILEGTKVIRIPMTFRSRFDLTNMRQIRDAVKKYDIQIINAQSSLDRYTSIFAKIIYRLNVKILHTRRQNPRDVGFWLKRKFITIFTQKVIVISEGLKEIFLREGFKPHEVHVIHNGMPLERYNQWSMERVNELKVKYGITDNDIVVGCVSRYKRQEFIVEAMAVLNRPEIKLMFVGIEKDILEPYLEKFQLKNEIIFTGPVEDADVLNYYKLFTVNVLASTMDGFGLVLLEALAMECPVIASDFGGIRDIIQEEENGLLFPNDNLSVLAQKIDRLVNDAALRNKFIEAGKKMVNKFSIEHTITNYEKFYTSFVDKSDK